jgi:hypothetical protein
MVVALKVGSDGGAKQRLAPKGALKPIEQSAGETRVLITPVTDKDRSAHRPTTRWSWSPQLARLMHRYVRVFSDMTRLFVSGL